MSKLYSAVLTKNNGEYIATCPELILHSEGDTVEEALTKLREIIQDEEQDNDNIEFSFVGWIN